MLKKEMCDQRFDFFWELNTTKFVYNEQKKVVSVQNQLGQEEVMSYDQDGNRISKVTKKGDLFMFTYNKNNKITGKTFPGDSVSYIFDGDNLLTKTSDADSWIEKDYDIFKRLSSETVSHAPAKVVYSYNLRGEVSELKLFVQNRSIMDLKKLYHQTGQVYQVTGSVSGERVEFSRDLNDNNKLSRINFPNGAWTSRVYDKSSRLIEQTTSINANLNHFLSYRYNGSDNITFVQDEFNGLRRINRFKYDELGRLVEEDSLEKRTYALDALGNDLSNGQYNELNQLLENSEFLFEYDLNGNRTKKTSKINGDKFEYRYSAENRLEEVKVFKSGNILSKTITHSYDSLGRRIIRSVQDHLAPTKSYTRKFIYERQNILAVLDDENNFVSGYVHGEGIDDPILMVTDINGDGEFEVLSIVKDHQNSVRFILNDAGGILQEIEYSAYGETKIVNRDQNYKKLENIFYYTSRELERETGEYFYRARFYDPSIQKFLSEDPLGFRGGDKNFYRYSKNKPLTKRDPLGLYSDKEKECLDGASDAANAAAEAGESEQECARIQRTMTAACGVEERNNIDDPSNGYDDVSDNEKNEMGDYGSFEEDNDESSDDSGETSDTNNETPEEGNEPSQDGYDSSVSEGE